MACVRDHQRLGEAQHLRHLRLGEAQVVSHTKTKICTSCRITWRQ
jgi:hypothetical protein